MSVVRSRRTRLPRALRALLWAAPLILGSCGGDDTSPPGTPVITMGSETSNPDPDFASYGVSIDSMTLTRNDGTVVEPIVTPETVDLNKLTSLSELVEAPAVPSGTYLSGTVTIDYTVPSVWLSLNGAAVFATVTGPADAVISAVSVPFTFDPAHPLVITAGQSLRLNIDVDLEASNTLVTTTPAVVQAQPFVVVSPAPVNKTVMRARGLFVTTDTVPSGFIMNIRPFYDLVSALGAVTVNTTAQTYYNVNGVEYTGTAGLAAIQALQVSTTLAAYGTLDDLTTITPSFNATAVYAGTSLEDPLAEYVTGTVYARSGTTIDLRGVSYLTPDGTSTYIDAVAVVLGSSTVVSKDGIFAPGLGIADISIGQQVTIAGQANVDPTTGDLLYLDATAGQVRLQSSRAFGTLNSATANSLFLELLQFDNFDRSGYAFAGTNVGGTAGDYNNYQVNTGSLNESAVAPGTLLQVDGFVTPFGTAPPNFTASAVAPATAVEQTLVCEFTSGGVAHPFRSYSAAGLIIDFLSGVVGNVHFIRSGPATLDLMSLPASPLITTVGADATKLQLAIGSSTLSTGVSVFNTMAGFITGLNAALNGTNKVFRVVAYGQYNSGTNTFVATRIHVAVQET
jgi:hypothetical protein